MTQAITLRECILGGLWGAIVGDALGVPVEFTSREARQHDPVIDMRGYGTHHQPAGTWSDDSSLLLCTVEALCEKDYRPERLAELFLAWKDRGYWTPHGTVFDIGIATSTALSRLHNETLAEEAGGASERDNGNGSLMRILPVALRYANVSTEEMLFMAHRISAITHRHPRSQMACGLYCCMAKGLLTGLTPLDAYRFMIDQGQRWYSMAPFHSEYAHFSRIFSGVLPNLPQDEIASSGYVIHTLEASLWCLLHSASYESAVLSAVNLGEDTDTTGCVAGGIAGLWFGMTGIPDGWIENLIGCDTIRMQLLRFVHHITLAR